MPITTFSPTPESARAFRSALGAFPTGVTVVSAEGAAGPVGMTANSFASVSLDPPLILWSPARASSRFGVFAGAGHFAVHVLGMAGHGLAQRFARSGVAFGPHERDPAHGVPLLQEGWLARFLCAQEAVHEAGDHAIIIGRVLRVDTAPGTPLVFAQGSYAQLAPQAAFTVAPEQAT